jgi:hypothetical protein
VSGMVLRKTGRGPGWSFRQLRLGLPDVDNHGSQHQQLVVLSIERYVAVIDVVDK